MNGGKKMKDETKITVTGSPSKKETKQVVANNTDKDGTLKSDKEKSFVIPLEKLIEKAKEHEPPPFIWRGIKKGSCGYIFGPAKSGKTIFCENLGLMLSLGADLFLESPLLKGNHKVLIISLEEYWEHRSERNIKQITRLSKEYGDKWKEYYFVADENAPRSLLLIL
jgi:RecA-family ATPase